MTLEEKQRVVEKIQKLFSLAENNPSEEEAQLALTTARRLLTKYNLSEDEVDSVERKSMIGTEGGSNEVILKTARIHDWVSSLVMLVSRYFDVKIYYVQGNKWGVKSKYVFYGVKMNSETAVYAFESLFNQVQTLAKKYKPSKEAFESQHYYSDYSIYSVQARFEYRNGLVSGLRNRLNEVKKQEVEEFGQSKITALAVRYDEVAENWLAKNNIRLVTGKSKRTCTYGTNSGAKSHGYADSVNLSIHKGALK